MAAKLHLLAMLMFSSRHVGDAQLQPPGGAAVKWCTIGSVFSKLQQIKSSTDCRAGCSGHACPPDWMPGKADVCSAPCGRIFEPFWDECGKLLIQAKIGGIVGLADFYNNCLLALYPPGSCGRFCNTHTYECYLKEVRTACCEEGESNCRGAGGKATVVPKQCPVGCAVVFPSFLETCRAHIKQISAQQAQKYAAFESKCLELDSLALIEYATDLQAKHCNIANVLGLPPPPPPSRGGRRSMMVGVRSRGGKGGGGGARGGALSPWQAEQQWRRRRRRVQGQSGPGPGARSSGFLGQWVGVSSRGCPWDQINDLARRIDQLCKLSAAHPLSARATEGHGQQCSPACSIALRQLQVDCKVTLDAVLPAGDTRRQQLDAFAARCIAGLDKKAVLAALMHAQCPSQAAVAVPPPRNNASSGVLTIVGIGYSTQNCTPGSEAVMDDESGAHTSIEDGVTGQYPNGRCVPTTTEEERLEGERVFYQRFTCHDDAGAKRVAAAPPPPPVVQVEMHRTSACNDPPEDLNAIAREETDAEAKRTGGALMTVRSQPVGAIPPPMLHAVLAEITLRGHRLFAVTTLLLRPGPTDRAR